MKKTYVSVIITVVTFSSIAYATPTSNLLINDNDIKKYYCPGSITCTKAGDPNSCSFTVENPEYWDNTIKFQSVQAGVYPLMSVTGTFHSPSVASPSCQYNGPGGYGNNPNYYLYFNGKMESNLEIYYNTPTNWTLTNGYKGSCRIINNDPQSCPLKEQPALVFYNENMGGGITVLINNTEVSRELTNGYGKVNYDTALHYCKGGKECRIDFSSTQGMYYGDVTVDMENSMKITKINSINPSYVSIRQNGGYNAVEVRYVSFLK